MVLRVQRRLQLAANGVQVSPADDLAQREQELERLVARRLAELEERRAAVEEQERALEERRAELSALEERLADEAAALASTRATLADEREALGRERSRSSASR